MDIHARILIDYSGSMGYMKGSQEFENKYLLSDGTPRIELVKKILIQDLIPAINHFKFINIIRFSSSVYNHQNLTSKYIYSGEPNDEALKSIGELPVPPMGGTPIYSAFMKYFDFVKSSTLSKKIIFIVTDGDSNDVKDFDEKILDFMQSSGYKCPIYIVGIDQNLSAETKSKNLCNKSGGKYVNLKAMDYDNTYIESMLFELKSNILNSSLNHISESTEIKPVNTTNVNDLKKKNQLEINGDFSDGYISKLEKTIEGNTNAIALIGKQLELIVNQISALKNSDLNEELEILEDSEFNLKIGRHAESVLNSYLKDVVKLKNCRWNNEIKENYEPYDFKIEDGLNLTYIECKSSVGLEKNFYLSKNEWNFFLDHKDNYELIFVSEVFKKDQIFNIGNLFQAIIDKKIVPYSIRNRKIKSDLAYFRIV
ncbi:MAG: protein NO VEIN domain-containing protein [Chryseobacterium sp.]|uniref:protein NO VEIN domain-containing protein n=1 Tax=Chryseobacterium sp. TaxID=1871047 RepID=UPI003D09FF60